MVLSIIAFTLSLVSVGVSLFVHIKLYGAKAMKRHADIMASTLLHEAITENQPDNH